MNGKSGVRVMINNKMMQLPMEAVIQMLDGMNASNVEKIELITAPPSEYDAEGNGGIIHIVTKTTRGLWHERFFRPYGGRSVGGNSWCKLSTFITEIKKLHTSSTILW